jgi:hypothetical protein
LYYPNLAQQLKWSRFVNTTGLHNEHLNKRVKLAIEGAKKAIIRTGRAIGVLTKAVDSFDHGAGVPVPSGKHYTKTMEKI